MAIRDIIDNAPPKKRLIIFLALCALITSAIVFVAVLLMPQDKAVNIDNINDFLSSTPAKDKVALEQSLYLIAKANNTTANELGPATIRDGSFSETLDNKVHYTSFLVDIDSIQQTYQISFNWSDEIHISNGIIINCPDPKDSKYPGVICKGMYNSSNDLYPMANVITWNYLYQINYTYGQGTGNKIIDSLKSFILENFPAVNGPSVIIDEGSLAKLSDQPGISYQFSATINNSNKATVIIQTDEGFGHQYIFAYMQDDTSKKYTAQLLADDQNIINTVSAWAKNYLNASDMTITVNKLN